MLRMLPMVYLESAFRYLLQTTYQRLDNPVENHHEKVVNKTSRAEVVREVRSFVRTQGEQLI